MLPCHANVSIWSEFMFTCACIYGLLFICVGAWNRYLVEWCVHACLVTVASTHVHSFAFRLSVCTDARANLCMVHWGLCAIGCVCMCVWHLHVSNLKLLLWLHQSDVNASAQYQFSLSQTCLIRCHKDSQVPSYSLKDQPLVISLTVQQPSPAS